MTYEMKLTELKQKLKTFDEKDLIRLVSKLYKSSDLARKIINAELLGDAYEKKALEQYKEKMRALFFPEKITKHTTFSLSEAKLLIREFKKISNSMDYQLDLQLYYVECGVAFTQQFGDIDGPFYSSMVNMYGKVVETLITQEFENLLVKYHERLHVILTKADVGWGFYENIADIYLSIPSLNEK